MSRKSLLRRPDDKQHGKWSQTLLKSVQQHLYHIYWSLWGKLSWKKPRLVICKIWLDKFLKSSVSEALQQATGQMVLNTVEICTTALLSYLLITAKAIELEKVTPSDTQNLRIVC